MIEYVIYMSSLLIFFFINLKILQALHIEKKFEKMKLWEIRAAHFVLALVVAHLLSEMMLKIASFSQII
jgi:hypothetical protein